MDRKYKLGAASIRYWIYSFKIDWNAYCILYCTCYWKAIYSEFLFQSTSEEKMSAGRTKTLQSLTISTFSYALLFVTLVVVLGIFDINATGLVAGAGVVGLAIGFGAQGLVSDVVTGFFLLLEKQVDVGDYVTAAGYDGVVEDVGLRTMQIRGFDGTLNYVPNREVTS